VAWIVAATTAVFEFVPPAVFEAKIELPAVVLFVFMASRSFSYTSLSS
jgi:hypothetical protein